MSHNRDLGTPSACREEANVEEKRAAEHATQDIVDFAWYDVCT